jgi:hypothetical protein
MVYNGTFWLVPVDADTKSAETIRFTCISTADINKFLEAAGVNLLFIDTSFSAAVVGGK